MLDLTFVAQAQNYVKWVEFSTNYYFAGYRQLQKMNYKAGNTFV